MTSARPTRRRATHILAGLTAIALGLAACGEATTTAEQHPATAGANDPRALTGLSEVADLPEPEPLSTNPTPQLPTSLTDADGTDVTVTDISRIIALDIYGNYTKTLLGLGLGPNIVGRTVSSTEPSLKDLPEVTKGGHVINPEAVLQLEPTLVIVDHSIGPREAIDQLRAAGVTVVVMDPGHSIDSVAADITAVANVVGLPEQGAELARRAEEDMDTSAAAIKEMAPADPLRMVFLYARGNGGIFFILGSGTGAKDLITSIGGTDVATDGGVEGTAPATAEALAALNPEVIVMMHDGLTSAGGMEGLLARPGVAQTIAGQNQRVISLPDGQSLAFGPQTGELMRRTAAAVYQPGGN